MKNAAPAKIKGAYLDDVVAGAKERSGGERSDELARTLGREGAGRAQRPAPTRAARTRKKESQHQIKLPEIGRHFKAKKRIFDVFARY